MNTPRLTLNSITITAPDPRALAEFYGLLLGRPVNRSEGPGPGEPPQGGFAQVHASEGDGPTLNFEYERHWQCPVWPAVPGRTHATQHLDIWVEDLDAAVEHAISVGATLAEEQPQETVRVLFDPSGHPFCLFL
ncbi:VOC family protein [Glycomyces buryatensis]|uniref:VOC family protein n=1 Tax=Glycomyces buryatensis TaxID=2570927 RepID=A0A4S8QG41_9ACTN|nr:VOC family protein [Glycomyces buryatensis]THV41915.1 VOC family protein [Glycomyces buryatensis]